MEGDEYEKMDALFEKRRKVIEGIDDFWLTVVS
jgi:hypothetical protein